jgi:cytochrome c-type biogenesis protein CcmF
VLLAIGVAGSSAYQTVREQRLSPGGSMTVAGNTYVFRGYESFRGPNYKAIRAVVDEEQNGRHVATLKPGKNDYLAEDQVNNEVAIRHDWLTGANSYLIADQVNANGTVDLKVLQKPLVDLIWFAGFIFVAGSLITLWPDAREERRLSERYAGAFAEA